VNELGKIQRDVKINMKSSDKSQDDIKKREQLENTRYKIKERRYIYVYHKCHLYDNRREER